MASGSLVCAKGSYAASISDLVTRNIFLKAQPTGSVVLSGKTAVLAASRRLVAAAGTSALVGSSLGESRRFVFPAATVNYSIATPGVFADYSFKVATGSEILSSPGAAQSRAIAATKGTTALTGKAVNLGRGVHVIAVKGTITLSGNAAILARGAGTRPLTITAASGSFRVTGTTNAFRLGYHLAAAKGVLAVTGNEETYESTGRVGILAETGVYFLQGKSIVRAEDWTPPTVPFAYVGDRHVARSGDDYAVALANLLPQGIAWPREKDSVLMKLVSGLGQIWGQVDASAAQLLEKESDPRTTVTLLPDWERNWGLPDRCSYDPLHPQTIDERQNTLTMRMTLEGGQSRQFFIGVASWLGYKIQIREWSPFMCGVSRCGDTSALDPLGKYRWEIGEETMRFYWSVQLNALRYTWFRCSGGQCGVDPMLRIAGAADLECMLRRWKPAHTVLLFDYTPLQILDFTQPFNSQFLVLWGGF